MMSNSINNNKFNKNKLDRNNKPYKVVPKRLRILVYKEVLDLYCESTFDRDKLRGLCIMLPDIAHKFDKTYPLFINSVDTNLIFPEIRKYVGTKTSPYVITYKVQLYRQNSDEWRIEVLKKCLKDCGVIV